MLSAFDFRDGLHGWVGMTDMNNSRGYLRPGSGSDDWAQKFDAADTFLEATAAANIPVASQIAGGCNIILGGGKLVATAFQAFSGAGFSSGGNGDYLKFWRTALSAVKSISLGAMTLVAPENVAPVNAGFAAISASNLAVYLFLEPLTRPRAADVPKVLQKMAALDDYNSPNAKFIDRSHKMRRDDLCGLVADLGAKAIPYLQMAIEQGTMQDGKTAAALAIISEMLFHKKVINIDLVRPLTPALQRLRLEMEASGCYGGSVHDILRALGAHDAL